MEDKLKEAMQEECFTLVDNYDNPKIILFGKRKIGSTVKDGIETENFQYCIGENWDNNEDFSMHHLHSYDGVIKWLDIHTEGYKYYKQLHEKRLSEII